MMALLRLTLSIATAVSMHIVVTAPVAQSTLNERVRSSTFREMLVMKPAGAQSSYLLTMGVIWFNAFGEVMAILCPYLPQTITKTLPFRPPPPPPLTPAFVIGTVLVIGAGLLRKWSYLTLGPLFTFELSIKQNHKLMTKGPYSFVRHPSYTGTFLFTVGLFLMYGSRGSGCGVDFQFGWWWLKEPRVRTLVKTVVWVWYAVTVLITTNLFSRAADEDKLMKERFGEEWDQWARRVRYRIVPGVY